MKEVIIKEVDNGFILTKIDRSEHIDTIEKHIEIYEIPSKSDFAQHANFQRVLFWVKVFFDFQKEDHEHFYEEENNEYCMICGETEESEEIEEHDHIKYADGRKCEACGK